MNETFGGLKALDRLKDEFISMAAHELKTPLTPMLSLVRQMLARDFGKLNEKQEKALGIISRGAERLGVQLKRSWRYRGLNLGGWNYLRKRYNWRHSFRMWSSEWNHRQR